MTKTEEIKRLKDELARYEKAKDPYDIEMDRIIRKMPVEIVKCRIPKLES